MLEDAVVLVVGTVVLEGNVTREAGRLGSALLELDVAMVIVVTFLDTDLVAEDILMVSVMRGRCQAPDIFMFGRH